MDDGGGGGGRWWGRAVSTSADARVELALLLHLAGLPLAAQAAAWADSAASPPHKAP